MQDDPDPTVTKATLITKWTAQQNALAQKLIFEDQGLSFSVEGKSTDATLDGTDYDTPAVWVEDLSQIQVEGLHYVGGLDISFVDNSLDETASNTAAERNHLVLNNATTSNEPDAYATMVVLEFPSLKLVHEITEAVHLTVPYIPSFLAYREAPAYLSLLSSLRAKLKEANKSQEFPQILLVDGNGRLHTRQAGSACAIGWESGIPTFGVAKNYLPTHSWDHTAPIDKASKGGHWRETQNGMRKTAQEHLVRPGSWFGLFGNKPDANHPRPEYTGAAVLPPGKAKNPIFVSTGHRISLCTAIRLTLVLSRTRIPEPVRLADQISRQAVRDASKRREGNGHAEGKSKKQ
ncbi:hypothetical protein FRB98_005973 [Tulasnella sp. 332]|nr:hypothetical protein FRB98_005973 [Tulasnella sp. 332]